MGSHIFKNHVKSSVSPGEIDGKGSAWQPTLRGFLDQPSYRVSAKTGGSLALGS